MKIVNRRERSSKFRAADEETPEIEFWLLSLDEEYAIAKWVMDVLCLHWIDTRKEFQRFLTGLIYRKSMGKDFTNEHFEKLADYIDRYGENLPPFPVPKDNGKYIVYPLKFKGDNAAGLVWYQDTISRAWYESWDANPLMRKRAGMEVFPGWEPDEQYRETQKELERKFWEEVDVKQQEYGCSRKDAITAVSDYMPRGSLDEL